MHLVNPVGHLLWYGPRKFTVIGVTDNVVMESPYKPVDPLMIYYQPHNTAMISIRLAPGAQPHQAIAAIEPIVKKNSPSTWRYPAADTRGGEPEYAAGGGEEPGGKSQEGVRPSLS